MCVCVLFNVSMLTNSIFIIDDPLNRSYASTERICYFFFFLFSECGKRFVKDVFAFKRTKKSFNTL